MSNLKTAAEALRLAQEASDAAHADMIERLINAHRQIDAALKSADSTLEDRINRINDRAKQEIVWLKQESNDLKASLQLALGTVQKALDSLEGESEQLVENKATKLKAIAAE